jgi:predicted RNA-binding Zn-ribbon protein involved in translation (DUF1610 family)
MPIIIWGSRGITSRLNSGQFHCPRCQAQVSYDLQESRPYFTIYFIPLFPVGSGQRYVECRRCGGTFREEVLDMQPAEDGASLLREIEGHLQAGRSLEEAQSALESIGMVREQADRVVTEVAGTSLYQCPTCRQHYLRSVGRCRKCPS